MFKKNSNKFKVQIMALEKAPTNLVLFVKTFKLFYRFDARLNKILNIISIIYVKKKIG